MGILGRFKGASATATAAVQSADIVPGGTLDLSYEIGGELDDKCRAVIAGLTCIGTFITEERGRDANGHPIERDVRHEVKLHDEQQDLPLAVGSGLAEFKLPEDAAPSSADAVAWEAWVQLDRGDSKSPIDRIPLALREPDGSADLTPDVTDTGLTLHGVPGSVRAGETVTGTLTVNAAEDVKVSAVTIRLNRRRTYVSDPLTDYGRDSLLIDTVIARSIPYSAYQFLGVAEVEIFGHHSFEGGTPEQAPFSLTLPSDVGPSTRYPYGEVDWWLDAVLDRRLHDDLTVAIPITVL
jgi:hypothetical protein